MKAVTDQPPPSSDQKSRATATRSRPSTPRKPTRAADVSSIPPLIPYGGFPPVRLEGWPVRRGLPGRQRLKPAPGMRLLTPGLPSPFVHLRVGAVVPYCAGPLTVMMHRHGGWVALRPRGPRSGPGYAVPVRPCLTGPIRPTRRHIATSPETGVYAMPSTRCLRCAGAPRRPASGSGLSLPFRPDMPSSLTPGSPTIAYVQFRDADTGLRRDPSGSALPTLPQSVSRGTWFSRLHWFANCYGLSGCSPPWTDRTKFPRPPGAFTSRLRAGRSPSPPLDMTTTATGLLCWRDFHPQEWQLASLHVGLDRGADRA